MGDRGQYTQCGSERTRQMPKSMLDTTFSRSWIPGTTCSTPVGLARFHGKDRSLAASDESNILTSTQELAIASDRPVTDQKIGRQSSVVRVFSDARCRSIAYIRFSGGRVV